MNAKRVCSSCGSELPADAPSGLCVACLFKNALPSDPSTRPNASPKSTILVSPDIPASENPGDRIGRYKLLQQIGEGGMGTVWMAEQDEPVQRKVALKVIKLGMDTKQVIGRFEIERRALAMMDHPNIAKVFDGGVTNTGRPYFVMELVKGIPITKYCDDKKLNTRERLELFIPVCRAIQHAHQKAIIHRDISPSNVLVANYDGKPVPMVIDFGIAKATGQKLTDKTVFTGFGQFIGKPAYMCPEQAELNAMDVDTRADIYALGVLLYELLTGKTPLDAKDLVAAGFEAMRKMIQEKEPPRPSTRISSLSNAEQSTMASQRQAEPPKLIRLVRGDLDWVTMKCLEKDRSRRYGTANGLAADIERHLNNEPVVARPPSNIYRFQKFVRRNKLAFAAVTAISCVLVFGTIVSTWLAVRATRAERRAESEAGKKFLLTMLSMGAETADFHVTDRAMNMNWKVVTNEAAAKMLDTVIAALPTKPDADESLLFAMMYYRIAEFEKAENLLRRAVEQQKKEFGDSDARIARNLSFLGLVLSLRRDWPQAEVTLREALALQKKALGESHPDVVDSLNSLGLVRSLQADLPGAEALYREALAIARNSNVQHQSKHIGVVREVDVMLNLADLLRNRNALAEARSLAQEAVALQQSYSDVLGAKSNRAFVVLGKILEQGEEYAEALTWFRKAADGGDSKAQAELGCFHREGKGVALDYQEAMKWFQKAAEQKDSRAEAYLGYMHRDGLGIATNYPAAQLWYRKAAEQEDASGQFGLSLMYFHGLGVPKDEEEAFNWCRKAADQSYAEAQTMLGQLYRDGVGVARNFNEALNWLRKAADQRHAMAQHDLACMYRDGQGVVQDYGEALKWERKAAEQGSALGQNGLAYLYEEGKGVAQDYQEAMKWYRKAAEQNDAYGLMSVGYMYENGRGVTRDFREAIKWYRRSADRGSVQAMDFLARIFATSAEAGLRDGASAVIFGEKAAERTKRKDPHVLANLAAAYAEVRDFAKAVSVQMEAIALLQEDDAKKNFTSRLKLYESNTPYRATEK